MGQNRTSTFAHSRTIARIEPAQDWQQCLAGVWF